MPYLITVDYLSAALAEIEKREGPYNRDQLEHAENTIDAMAKVAHDALNGEWEPPALREEDDADPNEGEPRPWRS